MPAGEPQKVRNRKPRTTNPTVDNNRGVQGQQQPPIRETNRGAQQQPAQPEAANWTYNQGDHAYGNADPAQSYPEHYDYGGEHVDGYRYDGAQVAAAQDYHGYGGAAGQGYHGYDVAGQGYDYNGGNMDAGQGYGYGYDHDYNSAHVEATQGYGYDGAGQEHGYGGAQAGQEYGYAAPTQQVKLKPTKSRNPRPVADGAYPAEHHAGYQTHHQTGDGYGQPAQGGYADGYTEGYGSYTEQQPSKNPPGAQKRESKNRKPSRTKSLEKGNESTLASRAVAGEPDGVGSGRSRTSQEGSGSNRSKPDRSDGSSRHVNDATPSNDQRRASTRSKEKLENEGTAAAGSRVPAKSLERDSLNEHLRKTGGGGKSKPAFQDVSMAVFDPQDRTLISGTELPAQPSLDEWMKKQGQGPKFQQDESLIVFDDHDKSELETRMFGAPLAQKQAIKLPPMVEKPQYQPRGGGNYQRQLVPVEKPQYQPRGGENYNYQHQLVPAVQKPQYQPVQRRQQANSPLPIEYQAPEAGAIQQYDAEGKQVKPGPNAACMACVHGIGVPVARLATRIACRQCMMCACTIL